MSGTMADNNSFAAIASSAATEPPLTTRNKQERDLLLAFRTAPALAFNKPRILVLHWTGATLVLMDTERIK